ncbi:MAG TPA: methyltransferase domain-containing protein [Solirubrobacteraceae bacterium]
MNGATESGRRWYHTIDFPDGTVTPGFADTRGARAQVSWPSAMAGGRCLDVGTFDGFWAFEMERLGAREVIALDVEDPTKIDWPYDWRRAGPQVVRADGRLDGSGFTLAAAALEASATRTSGSVYELDPEIHGRFDVAFCGALLLHLQDPVRALEAIRDVCAGELVLVEHLDPLLELIAPRVPCARVAPEGDQWWRANSAGLVRLLARAGFELTWLGRRFLVPHGPGWSNRRSLTDSLAARSPRGRGALHRAFRARARPPADAAELTGALERPPTR